MVAAAIVDGLKARVAVTTRLWTRTPDLSRAERALFALQGCFPRYDADSTLLKVVAAHSLDSNRTLHVAHWTQHVTRTLVGVDARNVGVELVDALATLPELKPSEHRRALTFASRFAHYFVDADRFPVLDAWTEAELERLVPATVPGECAYVDFADRHAKLAAALGLVRPRQLGHYLWLASQHRAWVRNPRMSIQRAARKLFEAAPPELALLAPLEETRDAQIAA